jgi:hypothetical protein
MVTVTGLSLTPVPSSSSGEFAEVTILGGDGDDGPFIEFQRVARIAGIISEHESHQDTVTGNNRWK